MILLAKKIQHFVDLIVAKSLSQNEEEIFRLNHYVAYHLNFRRSNFQLLFLANFINQTYPYKRWQQKAQYLYSKLTLNQFLSK
ncbi:diguanylate cyclase [Sulfurospirillum diekertiae]|uniref:Diguanylate cyclase n=1 Tax=Sulfurospirillum diekertiae TaxID=1854492 RepID=A0A290HUP8_9BACT|nr:diguanylate cyclase [Sulfurospirillum diekertiae]